MQGRDTVRRKLEAAILETVLYSDLFDYPLTYAEIAHYLIRVDADVEAVCACLASPRFLNGHLQQIDGLVYAGRRESIVERRRARRAPSGRLWMRARRFARLLALLPFVRMVAVTGALAMNNSTSDDDIDVLIITAPRRVWLARLFAVGLVLVGKLFGDTLCPNYIIGEDALALERHDLFVAHEFVQMVPLYGLDVYDAMRRANTWVHAFMPNARSPFRREPEIRTAWIDRFAKRVGERLLSGRLGDALEEWEMRRKQRKFSARISNASDAVLDHSHVKGHFNDYGAQVLQLYAELLAQFPLADSEPET